MKRILLALLMGMFLVSLVAAAEPSIGSFQRDTDISLIQVCNCTFNNITNVLYPNGTVVISDQIMNRSGTYFNFTLDEEFTGVLGIYTVNGIGNDDGLNTPWSYFFEVTPSGAAGLGEGEGFTLFGILITLIVATVFFLIATIYVSNIPFKVFLGSLSVLMLVGTIGFGVTIMQQLFGTNADLVAGYGTFFRMFIILLMGGGAGLILYLVVVAMKSFNRHRGLID